MRNLITDVAGVRVGHAGDPRLGSGVTVVMFDEPATASIDVRGGGPGTQGDRPARSGADRQRHRRHRAVGRLGLRARCGFRCAGLSA